MRRFANQKLGEIVQVRNNALVSTGNHKPGDLLYYTHLAAHNHFGVKALYAIEEIGEQQQCPIDAGFKVRVSHNLYTAFSHSEQGKYRDLRLLNFMQTSARPNVTISDDSDYWQVISPIRAGDTLTTFDAIQVRTAIIVLGIIVTDTLVHKPG